MKALIIVARDYLLGELEELLHNNGIIAYSVLSKLEGTRFGRAPGTFLSPASNSLILVVLPSDQADRAVSALKAHHAGRIKARHGEPDPLKVFSFPCEEHI